MSEHEQPDNIDSVPAKQIQKPRQRGPAKKAVGAKVIPITAAKSAEVAENSAQAGLPVEPSLRIPVAIIGVDRSTRSFSFPWTLCELDRKVQVIEIYPRTKLRTNKREVRRLTCLGRDICEAIQSFHELEWIELTRAHELTISIGTVFQWSSFEPRLIEAIRVITEVPAGGFSLRRLKVVE